MAKRQDTTLESEGAEFLVLGLLLTYGIPAYKAYSKNTGHDLVAVNPEKGKSVRIEVKSRWATDSHWNMGTKERGATDFYVFVRLNRGNKNPNSKIVQASSPEFYVFPEKTVWSLPQTVWKQAKLKKLENTEDYRDRWDAIQSKLLLKPSFRRNRQDHTRVPCRAKY